MQPYVNPPQLVKMYKKVEVKVEPTIMFVILEGHHPQ